MSFIAARAIICIVIYNISAGGRADAGQCVSSMAAATQSLSIVLLAAGKSSVSIGAKDDVNAQF